MRKPKTQTSGKQKTDQIRLAETLVEHRSASKTASSSVNSRNQGRGDLTETVRDVSSLSPQPEATVSLHNRKVLQLVPDSKGGLRFRVEHTLGCGATASVLRAHDFDLERDVALKVYGKRASQSGKISSDVTEARVLASLEHPNIVPIHDLSITADGRLALIMRHVKGQTLGEEVHRAPFYRQPPGVRLHRFRSSFRPWTSGIRV